MLNNLVNLMLNAGEVAKPMPDWISKSFPVIQTILLVLVAIASVVIIVAVLMTTSNGDGGNNAITGTNDSYYMQHKGGSKEGRLKTTIIVCAITIFVLTLLYFISFGIYTGFSV